MPRRVLVTGGAGFIGSSVVDQLLDEGSAVAAFDNFDPYYSVAQKRRNVARALTQPGYELIEADVRERDAVFDAVRRFKPELIVHLAAKAGVRASVEKPAEYLQVNEQGGLNIMEAAREHGNVPVVYSSTSSVYGATKVVPFREDDPAMGPLSPYAATKRGAELMVHALHHLHGQPVCILRFFTVYGPRGRPDMAVHTFTRKLLAGETIRLHGEETERDFTFVDDIVKGVLGALSWVAKGSPCDTFNLGRSEPVRVRRLIEIMAAALGVEAKVELGELGASESPVTAANVDKARAAFGYDPQVSLADGIARWVDWCRNSDEAPTEIKGRL